MKLKNAIVIMTLSLAVAAQASVVFEMEQVGDDIVIS